ncbi:hypothetical protein IP69_16035 [Bosea sp. AAP35]|nr:hypothetical protein IP69_16035 [Bosea sp. AAP35]
MFGSMVPLTAAAGVSMPLKPTLHIKQNPAQALHVSEQAARRIAWRFGFDHIEEIVLAGDRWEIAGRDRAGHEKLLDIHAYDGRILN